jgi:hypothetical protein
VTQSTIAGQSVTLDGSASSDANGDAITYEWSVVSALSGSKAVVITPTAEVASFTPDLAGTFVVQLIVNDGSLDSLPATVEIEAVKPRTQMTEDIRNLQRTIANLPKKAFKHAALGNALLDRLNAVIESVRAHKYAQATQQLQNDILAKTNGCATSGLPDKRDWIVRCPDQSVVYTPLLNIIAEVKALRGN